MIESWVSNIRLHYLQMLNFSIDMKALLDFQGYTLKGPGTIMRTFDNKLHCSQGYDLRPDGFWVGTRLLNAKRIWMNLPILQIIRITI